MFWLPSRYFKLDTETDLNYVSLHLFLSGNTVAIPWCIRRVLWRKRRRAAIVLELSCNHGLAKVKPAWPRLEPSIERQPWLYWSTHAMVLSIALKMFEWGGRRPSSSEHEFVPAKRLESSSQGSSHRIFIMMRALTLLLDICNLAGNLDKHLARC